MSGPVLFTAESQVIAKNFRSWTSRPVGTTYLVKCSTAIGFETVDEATRFASAYYATDAFLMVSVLGGSLSASFCGPRRDDVC